MQRIGVNEESFDSFIVDVYNRCKYIGLSPENIAFHLGDLLEFSKIVPLSKIPDYVEEKTLERLHVKIIYLQKKPQRNFCQMLNANITIN